MKNLYRILSTAGMVFGVFFGTAIIAYAAAYAVGVGGTGWTNIQAHSVLVGNGTTRLATTSPGSSTQVLTSNGASADPTFQSLPANVSSFNTRTGAVTLTTGDVTTALGFTPFGGTTPLPILSGGTNAAAQTTNGVNYFDGTSITSGTALVFDGTHFGVGTSTPGTALSIKSTQATQFLLAYDDTNSAQFQTTSGGDLNIHASGNDISTNSADRFIVQGNFRTGGADAAANLSIPSALSGSNQTSSNILLPGATGTTARLFVNGTQNPTPTAGNNYAAVVIGKMTVTEAGSGNHPLLTQLAVRPFLQTNGTATVSTTSTVYIEDSASTTVATGGNYSFYIAGGDAYINGALSLAPLATAAGTLVAIDNHGKFIATTTPSSSGCTGTTGQTSYFSGTNTCVGTSTIFITSASAVGIGTLTPSAQLDVKGTTTDATAQVADFWDSANTNLLRIRNDGHIGIGTTSPMSILSIAAGQISVPVGTAAAPTITPITDTTTGIYFPSNQMNFSVGGTLRFDVTSTSFQANSAAGVALLTSAGTSATAPNIIPNRSDTTTGFGAQASGNIVGIVAGAEKTRWTSTGFGIGSTTPGSVLSIGGNGTGINFYDNATSTFSKGIQASDFCTATKCLSSVSSGGSGITAIGPTGQTQSGPTVTISTSTTAFNGLTSNLTITGSGNNLLFAPTLSGTLGVVGGGSGVGTFTSSQLIYGNGTNALSSVATSSLAVSSSFSYSGTLGSLVGGSGGTLSIAANGISPTMLANSDFGNFTCATGVCTIDNASVTNAMLANSTISGVSLGSTLAALSATNSTLTFSGSYTGTAAQTVGLNLGNSNNWTALTGFGTSTPAFNLSVSSGAQQSGLIPLFAVASTTNATILTALGNGNVGVGTSTPGSIFGIQGVANFTTGTSTLLSTLLTPNIAISNLTSGKLVGVGAGGYLQNINIGTGLSLTGGTLSVSGGGGSTVTTTATTSIVSAADLYSNSISVVAGDTLNVWATAGKNGTGFQSCSNVGSQVFGSLIFKQSTYAASTTYVSGGADSPASSPACTAAFLGNYVATTTETVNVEYDDQNGYDRATMIVQKVH